MRAATVALAALRELVDQRVQALATKGVRRDGLSKLESASGERAHGAQRVDADKPEGQERNVDPA
jgi:hypothetical protein